MIKPKNWEYSQLVSKQLGWVVLVPTWHGDYSCRDRKESEETLSPGWNISQIMQSLFIGNHLLLLEAMSRALWRGWIIPPTIPICQSQMITQLLRAPVPGALSYSEWPHLYFVHPSHCALSHIFWFTVREAHWSSLLSLQFTFVLVATPV